MRRLFACVLIVAGIAACVAPPEKERHEAEAALAAARQADAALYAPAELQAADAALTKYDEAVAQRDYRQALSAALEARDLATQAGRAATSRKADAQRAAEQLIAGLDAAIKSASARLSGAAGPRPTGAAAERLRAALRTASSVLQKARSDAAQGAYQQVEPEVTPAVDALRRELPASRSSRPLR
jgi:hypothetical protein